MIETTTQARAWVTILAMQAVPPIDGLHGLVLSMLGAFTVYLKYARLWEMHILKGAVEVPAQVEAGGPPASEEIGRMMDEETRPRPAAAPPARPGRPGESAPPR